MGNDRVSLTLANCGGDVEGNLPSGQVKKFALAGAHDGLKSLVR